MYTFSEPLILLDSYRPKRSSKHWINITFIYALTGSSE